MNDGIIKARVNFGDFTGIENEYGPIPGRTWDKLGGPGIGGGAFLPSQGEERIQSRLNHILSLVSQCETITGNIKGKVKGHEVSMNPCNPYDESQSCIFDATYEINRRITALKTVLEDIEKIL